MRHIRGTCNCSGIGIIGRRCARAVMILRQRNMIEGIGEDIYGTDNAKVI